MVLSVLVALILSPAITATLLKARKKVWEEAKRFAEPKTFSPQTQYFEKNAAQLDPWAG